MCNLHVGTSVESLLVYTDRRLYYDTVVEVSWDVVFALRELQSDFVLLLVSGDSASTIMEARLQQFVRSVGVGLLLVKVPLCSGSDAAKQLSVSLVPQIRLYKCGVELRRERGVVGYDRLRDFLGKGY